MTLFDVAAVLAQTGSASGTGAGFGVGMAVGVGAGIAVASSSVRKKQRRQLSQAIEDGEITVCSKSGKELTADDLLQLLGESYKKA